jgi:sarcosine oxidase, subunit beta
MGHSKQKVIVIGAGTLGMSTAWNLARRGAEVTVLDQGGLASGSSGRSVGVVGTQHVDDFEILIRTHSLRQLREWAKHGLDFHAIGYMRLGRDARDMALFEKSLRMQQAHGITSARVLDPAAIQGRVPHMNVNGIAGALFGSDDGFLDPHQMCTLLAGMVRELGGSVKQQCCVTAAEKRGTGWHVTTPAGTIACDAVVNAAGAWAPQVARLFGQVLHVLPERHQAVTIHLSEPLPYVMPMVMDLVQGGTGSGLNVRHDKPGQLITEIHKVSPSAGENPDNYNDQLDEAAKEQLAELLLERMPDLPGASFGRGWAGLYPKSSDGRPYVGPIDAGDPTLVTAAGAGGYGIQLGPVIGQLAADWILDGAPTSIPEARRLLPTAERNRASA